MDDIPNWRERFICAVFRNEFSGVSRANQKWSSSLQRCCWPVRQLLHRFPTTARQLLQRFPMATGGWLTTTRSKGDRTIVAEILTGVRLEEPAADVARARTKGTTITFMGCLDAGLANSKHRGESAA